MYIKNDIDKYDKREIGNSIVKKIYVFISFIALQLVFVNAYSQAEPPKGQKWNLVLNENFAIEEVDSNRWEYCFPTGRCDHLQNQELQYYTSQNVIHSSGVLKLIAKLQPQEVKINNRKFPYTSGMIATKQSYDYKFGYFEVNAKAPSGQGLWPAIWLKSRKHWPPEIDIMEILGHNPKQIYISQHWKENNNPHKFKSICINGTDFSKSFHKYAVEWTRNRITWYIDGTQLYSSVKNIPQEPLMLIINLAVGGTMPGNPDITTPLVSEFEIKSIKIWQQDE